MIPKLTFHIIMCLVWGATFSLVIIGFPSFIIDEIFGTYTLIVLDKGIFEVKYGLEFLNFF